MSMGAFIQDVKYAFRQLRKNSGATAVAVITLALATGACTSAFRLIDALLLRPLPIAEPERLFLVSIHGIDDGKPSSWDSVSYPLFRRMRDAVSDRADVVAISYADRSDLSFGSGQEMEKAHLQYVSGSMFSAFGLRPALGRLLVESDDLQPGSHPYAVLSYDYWSNRFGRDPNVIGRTFKMADVIYEIIGVAHQPFTGTEPGTVTDIFVPVAMQNLANLECPGCGWMRVLVALKHGVASERVREALQISIRSFNEERAKTLPGILSAESLRDFVNQKIVLESAASGVSDFQRDNRLPLLGLAGLAALVLLIACVNVANLMTIQAAARAREMALRLSIGASRFRLVQLVLIECSLIAALAAGAGACFAWRSAPYVVSRINSPDNPARLILPADWRIFAFCLALTAGVVLLFGLIPALRASGVKPVVALKGGDDPHSRRRLLHALIALQVAFCFLVTFVASLFVGTFERLSHAPVGFSAERVLTLDAIAKPPQLPQVWDQVTERLRATPGVQSVALASWPLLNGTDWNRFIFTHGGPLSKDVVHFLNISPGWIEAMNVRLLNGRDFLVSERYPGSAIVNEAFARQYFPGENPIGKSFETSDDGVKHDRFEIVGLVGNARYQTMREPVFPVAYVPIQAVGGDGCWEPLDSATFIVRTTATNSLDLALLLRQQVLSARPEFRLSRIRTQVEINQARTVQERLLATLALFFAGVAIALAGLGLFGVLRYSVLQRQRELAIRIALGARVFHIAYRVTADILLTVIVGVISGLTFGMASVRTMASLFYGVKQTDALMLGIPCVTLCIIALVTSVPAVFQAFRIDPAKMLRAE